MKKFYRKISFASLMLMASVVPAFAKTEVDASGICDLLKSLQGVFKILRTLAFIGAAFMIAGWAWGYISSAKIDYKKEVQEKGIALLVGFTLLFCIGAMLTFLTSSTGANITGCPDLITGW